MTYEIRINEKFNSSEIYFDCKPSEEVRNALKELKFRWHKVKQCWYGFASADSIKAKLEGKPEQVAKPAKAVKTAVNKYGVKVGDLFSASWGWEQTNVDFFQVVALVGECSVRVREVYPPMIEEDHIGPLAADRTYKLTTELLPPASRSVFIEDQEKGDIKRIKPGYYKDPELANKYCCFKLSDFASAYKCNGETETTYESWYA